MGRSKIPLMGKKAVLYYSILSCARCPGAGTCLLQESCFKALETQNERDFQSKMLSIWKRDDIWCITDLICVSLAYVTVYYQKPNFLKWQCIVQALLLLFTHLLLMANKGCTAVTMLPLPQPSFQKRVISNPLFITTVVPYKTAWVIQAELGLAVQ